MTITYHPNVLDKIVIGDCSPDSIQGEKTFCSLLFACCACKVEIVQLFLFLPGHILDWDMLVFFTVEKNQKLFKTWFKLVIPTRMTT